MLQKTQTRSVIDFRSSPQRIWQLFKKQSKHNGLVFLKHGRKLASFHFFSIESKCKIMPFLKNWPQQCKSQQQQLQIFSSNIPTILTSYFFSIFLKTTQYKKLLPNALRLTYSDIELQSNSNRGH